MRPPVVVVVVQAMVMMAAMTGLHGSNLTMEHIIDQRNIDLLSHLEELVIREV